VAAPTALNADARPPMPRGVGIVDDNVDAAESMAMLLRLNGHQVETAYSGATGLEAAASCRPEVVLLDISLPGMNGYEVAQELRRRPETAKLMLVALTGYGREEDRRLAREAGFDHHFTKPVRSDALLTLLNHSPSS